jgi:hypothetical protein
MSTTAHGLGQAQDTAADLESTTTTTLPLAVTDEKTEDSTTPQEKQEKKKGFFSFSPSKNKTDDKVDDKVDVKNEEKEPEFPPVPFPKLFRFHTKLDLVTNLIGLVCAIGSGAAQVRLPGTPVLAAFS